MRMLHGRYIRRKRKRQKNQFNGILTAETGSDPRPAEMTDRH